VSGRLPGGSALDVGVRVTGLDRNHGPGADHRRAAQPMTVNVIRCSNSDRAWRGQERDRFRRCLEAQSLTRRSPRRSHAESVELGEYRGSPVVRGSALDSRPPCRCATSRWDRTLVPCERLGWRRSRPAQSQVRQSIHGVRRRAGRQGSPPPRRRAPARQRQARRARQRPGNHSQAATSTRGRGRATAAWLGIDRGPQSRSRDQTTRAGNAGGRRGAAPGPEAERRASPSQSGMRTGSPAATTHRAAVRIVLVPIASGPQSVVASSPRPGRQQARRHATPMRRPPWRRAPRPRRAPRRGAPDRSPGDPREPTAPAIPAATASAARPIGVGHQCDPLRRRERRERRERDQPQHDRVAWRDASCVLNAPRAAGQRRSEPVAPTAAAERRSRRRRRRSCLRADAGCCP